MSAGQQKKILVTDDNELFRVKLKDLLSDAGHNVILARNGREAIDEIRNNLHELDLLILDLNMPDVDGFGVLKWINENGFRGKVPVLAMTGVYDMNNIMESLKNLGAIGFISKEFPPENIIFRINSILSSDTFTDWSDRKERIPVSILANFAFDNKKHAGSLLNINEDGAFLHTNIDIPKGSEMELRFSIPGAEKILTIRCTVRWCTYVLQKRSRLFWYGLMFTSVPREDHGVLMDFIAGELTKL